MLRRRSKDEQQAPVEEQRPDPEASAAAEPTGLDLETVRLALAANEYDLNREEDRMRTVEAKLTQLASFSGVVLTITAGLGGSTVASGRLNLGFTLALGACLSIAATFLLAAVIRAFVGLFPKPYAGVLTEAVRNRATVELLASRPADVGAKLAASRADMLAHARVQNEKKVNAVRWVFGLVGCGFSAIAIAVVVVSVGSVV